MNIQAAADRMAPSGVLADGRKACVFTVLLGGYEALNEQPMAAQSGLPFICLTDDPGLTSTSWELRLVVPLFPSDSVRSQRSIKLLPHDLLAGFDVSLYIDNSVVLQRPPEEIFALHLPPGRMMALPSHSYRDTVGDEFAVVADGKLDDPARIREQLEHTRSNSPEVLAERPHWSAILLRDHRDPALKAAMNLWLTHVVRYARRDQLSSNVAFRSAGFDPVRIEIDNFKSDWHVWPIIERRRHEIRHWSDSGEQRRDEPSDQSALVADWRHVTDRLGTVSARLEQSNARCMALQTEGDRQRRELETAAQGLEQARAEAARLRQALASSDTIAAAASARRDALLASTSWRLTAPLRAVRTMTRRRLQP